MDDQRPADGSPAWDDGRPEPVDGGADGPPPPPVLPPGAPPPLSQDAAVTPPGPPSAPPGTAPAARRRARWPLVVALVAVVVGVPVALAVLSGSGDDEGSVAAQGDEQDGDAGSRGDAGADGRDDPADEGGTGEDPGEPGDGGDAPGDDGDAPGDDDGAPGGVDPEAELEPLDLATLAGVDLTYGRLLTDIDASERTMIEFQAGLADAFSGAATPEDALDGAGEVAAEHREALLAARERLATPLEDPGADRVRERYVAHLDAWEGFMAAVEADPLAAFEQGESGATVRINATADAFARSLEAELPDDIDAEVARYAEDLLDRGFRDMGYADV